MKVVGYRIFDYTSKKTGRTYKACNLYVTSEGDPARGFVGEVTDSIFLPVESLGAYEPKVGDLIEVYYNRYGGVQAIDYDLGV